MKIYPTIEYKIDKGIDIYAFDKIDGSNIRAEWTMKTGFYKFGARRRLLDPNEEPLGEAIDLINEKYGESLPKIFYDNKWGRVLCFFEFWGPNSFAGDHEDEEHDITLIDVNPYKKGILLPADFIKFVSTIDTPRVLYHGKASGEFIQSVRDRSLPGMMFEGVVCKGSKKKMPVMFKIKSKEWIARVRDVYDGNQRTLDELLDKTELFLGESDKYRKRRFCPSCFRNGSLSPMCRCGHEVLDMPFEAQPPRKKASKTRWRRFFQEWYPGLDFNFHWRYKYGSNSI